ncbi:MAG TPA: YbhB/YbcL family Raf kinase inhibitor-like protein [Solirubrobacteraceae bacterium]|nr:YbhB/YbcL family Raf kinase inhibitor-like protein [Solirubrobacteraceae bacterium]
MAPAKTHKEEVAPHNERIVLTSPVIPSEGAIPSRYTCDGKDISPPLRWREIPPGTSELMLDVLKTKPVNGQLYFAWAVTGLKPTLPGLNAGKLPAGAIVGTNSAGHRGYHLCQPKGTDEGYVIALFALPHHIAAKPGFNAAALRLTAEHTAKYQALYIVNYERR